MTKEVDMTTTFVPSRLKVAALSREDETKLKVLLQYAFADSPTFDGLTEVERSILGDKETYVRLVSWACEGEANPYVTGEAQQQVDAVAYADRLRDLGVPEARAVEATGLSFKEFAAARQATHKQRPQGFGQGEW